MFEISASLLTTRMSLIRGLRGFTMQCSRALAKVPSRADGFEKKREKDVVLVGFMGMSV